MRVIRIDDEVYAWLQGQAKPFKDTPNKVLRRVAGLDQTTAGCTCLSGLGPDHCKVHAA